MKLKAKYNRDHYKTVDGWLSAVYRNNKKFIDSKLGDIDSVQKSKYSPEATFKKFVKGYIQRGMTPAKALKTASNSTAFTEVGDRLRSNAYSGLSSDKEAYKTFRELTKEKGRYTKIDFNKFKWDSSANSYIYNGIIKISFNNSPYEVRVGRV